MRGIDCITEVKTAEESHLIRELSFDRDRKKSSMISPPSSSFIHHLHALTTPFSLSCARIISKLVSSTTPSSSLFHHHSSPHNQTDSHHFSPFLLVHPNRVWIICSPENLSPPSSRRTQHKHKIPPSLFSHSPA